MGVVSPHWWTEIYWGDWPGCWPGHHCCIGQPPLSPLKTEGTQNSQALFTLDTKTTEKLKTFSKQEQSFPFVYKYKTFWETRIFKNISRDLWTTQKQNKRTFTSDVMIYAKLWLMHLRLKGLTLYGHNPFLYITCISIEPPSWNSNLIMSNNKIALFLSVPGSRCDEALRRAGLVLGPHSQLWPGGQVSSCPPQRSLSYCPQRTAKRQPSHTETEKNQQ